MKTGIFNTNTTRPDIYDLENGIKFPFNYCRISTPRTEWLRSQGAKWVLESWSHGEKSAFTGLRPTIRPGIYSGDLILEDGKHPIRAEHSTGQLKIDILPKKRKRRRKLTRY